MKKNVFCLGKVWYFERFFLAVWINYSYKIIFGKWHLSIDERIFFFFSQIRSWWVLSGYFSPPSPPLTVPATDPRSMSQQCHLRISLRSWRGFSTLGPLMENVWSHSKDSKEEIIFFRAIVDRGGKKKSNYNRKKWAIHPLAVVIMVEWQCGPIVGSFALIAGCVWQCVFEVCNLIDMQATAYPIPSCEVLIFEPALWGGGTTVLSAARRVGGCFTFGHLWL